MNIMQTLKKISVWRRLLLILILFGLSIESIYITNDLMMGNLSYQELVFTHLGDPTTFLSYVFFLLLAADFGFSRNGSKSAQYKTKRLGGSLGLAAAICGVFIALILVVSLLAMLLKSGSSISATNGALSRYSGWNGLHQRWRRLLLCCSFSCGSYLWPFLYS